MRIVPLFALHVFQGVGISAFTPVDLFFFALVIVEKQNKTSGGPFGTSGKVRLLRMAESENCGGRGWIALLLRSPFLFWVCLGVQGLPGTARGSRGYA